MSAPAAPLALEAVPLLGANTPIGTGWFVCAVRITNPGRAQVSGFIELRSELSWTSDPIRSTTRAPFSVAGQGVVTVQLPTHGFGVSPPQVQVRAVDSSGNELGTSGVAPSSPPTPFLFDLSTPSRVAPFLRSMTVLVENPFRGSYGLPQLAVSRPEVNPATGDPILPTRAAGYASATVVLARSETLARLGETERAALADWVLAGGSLAVAVTRPEDLRGEPLVLFTGGRPNLADVPASLRSPADFEVPVEPTLPDGSPEPPSEPDPLGYPSTPPGSGQALGVKRLAPSEAVAQNLVGYSGANLQASPWGASCSYGLGEVHLLAFDATSEPQVSDEWVHLKLVTLVQHSWDRRVYVAMPHAEPPLQASGIEAIRRELDPNQGARWAVGVAALLLLLYALLAGPLNFYLAARRGRPLRALIHLPIWAGSTLLLVVLLGVWAKGVHGRARRLTLVEAGAGMPRAAAVRFRGFYASSADRLTVRATERGGVLDVASRTDDTQRTLVVDRDGARLEQFQAKPWQTVLVREDGFISIGGGVSIVPGAEDGPRLVNRTARDLVAVVVRVPGEDWLRYFPRIADGARIALRAGEQISGSRLSPSAPARLAAEMFEPVADRNAPGIADAWRAFADVADRNTDWWPEDAPVVIAQMLGGEGHLTDSGLRVEADRVLLRVVGFGGMP